MRLAAGVVWWSSALTPALEGMRSIPDPGTPVPTLGIGASPLFRDLAGRSLMIAQLVSKKSDTLQKLVTGRPEPNPHNKKQE
jgi:hypothetical protein